MGNLMGQADGQQNMGRIERSRCAGRAAGSADPLHIQHHQERFPLDEPEAEVGVGRKPVGGMPVQAAVGNLAQNALDEVIPQPALIGCPLLHSGNGDFHGFAEADDAGHIFRSRPALAFLGAAMDNTGVDPQIRMIYLMLILGFLGWPGMARLVRGQILSLREQEFMTATEACGISVSRRIFRHLVPNVIPQLIVSCTMGLGSTIIIEATLSFLGLGVKFPFASWGNIINDVNNTFVLQNYWFIWIPAGVLLLLTVLAFNLVGDGLRDAFDPKMKR